MSGQMRVKKPRTRVERNTGTIVHEDKRKKLDEEALKADLDELLEEIDAVLEKNGQEVVERFVQRGGE